MKRILLIITFLTGIILTGAAQSDNPGSKPGERLAAIKMGYLTRQLNLSPEEAQRFWPVYNQYSAEIQAVRADQRQQKITELEAEDRILNIRKRYNGEFNRTLTPQKTNMLFKSERAFENTVRQEWIERRQMRQQQRMNMNRPMGRPGRIH